MLAIHIEQSSKFWMTYFSASYLALPINDPRSSLAETVAVALEPEPLEVPLPLLYGLYSIARVGAAEPVADAGAIAIGC